MIRLWNTKREARSKFYWNYFKVSEQIKHYEEWVSRNTPLLPIRFRAPNMECEDEESKKLRVERGIQNFITLIKSTKINSEKHKTAYMTLDNFIFETLSDIPIDNVKEYLRQMWKDECLQNEDQSHKIWKYTE
ncbi:hypothetical protein SNE40_021237 [Patella caerulea]|uniref:Uncharacterized protein n=1 Tax=Patella caerulea TaxID=87958 RepID=A0AAN8GGL1_PATCE